MVHYKSPAFLKNLVTLLSYDHCTIANFTFDANYKLCFLYLLLRLSSQRFISEIEFAETRWLSVSIEITSTQTELKLISNMQRSDNWYLHFVWSSWNFIANNCMTGYLPHEQNHTYNCTHYLCSRHCVLWTHPPQAFTMIHSINKADMKMQISSEYSQYFSKSVQYILAEWGAAAQVNSKLLRMLWV